MSFAYLGDCNNPVATLVAPAMAGHQQFTPADCASTKHIGYQSMFLKLLLKTKDLHIKASPLVGNAMQIAAHCL
jgi:hypothetical protein